jgi:hypothetical protein
MECHEPVRDGMIGLNPGHNDPTEDWMLTQLRLVIMMVAGGYSRGEKAKS